MHNLDNTDLKLLAILGNNSDLTTKELAQMVNLSPTPVFERVKRLKKEGYIKKYIALIDPEKLNRGFIVFCHIKLKQHHRLLHTKFVQDIDLIDEVVECYNVSGEYDFLLKVYANDMKHYQDFVFNKLSVLDSIGSTHSSFVMKEIKNQHNIAVGLVQSNG